MRVFKSSITSTFGRRERGRVVEVVRARGFQSRHSSSLVAEQHSSERERERVILRENKVVRVTVALSFLSSLLLCLRKKKKRKIHQKSSQIRKSLPVERNIYLSSSFFCAARYIYITHAQFYRTVILFRANTRYKKRETTARQKKRVKEFFFFGGFVRVRESRRERCTLSQRVRRSRAVGDI